ncbi:MAG: IscS subfamily cysteine desulfurase [Lentihominibacter sp.]
MKPDEIIVDIRNESLFEQGTIPGAINIPMSRVQELYGLPMDKRICLLCHVGEISDELAIIMREAGYDVYSYPGGYAAYLEKNEEEDVEIIYADNASTTAMSERAFEAYSQALECYGNPSTLHRAGRRAKKLLTQCRQEIAELLGAKENEIVFTSGGSESDNHALIATARLMGEMGKNHIISDTIEHHAILHTLEKLEAEGFEVTLLEPDGEGIITPEAVADAVTEQTGLVSIMYANNEIGTIEPIREIGRICKDRGIIFHTDAVQAAGHIEIDVREDNIDLMSVSGHKFHGPRGTGLLYVREGIKLPEFISGGAQEMGLRAGTENLPAIAGMAAALKDSLESIETDRDEVIRLRDKLVSEIGNLPGAILNGHIHKRLPGNVNFSFEELGDTNLLMELDAHGICVSAGSACSASDSRPSHVLTAIGRTEKEARNSVRITIDEYNTEEEVDKIIDVMKELFESI